MAQNLIGTIYDDNGHAIASSVTGRASTGVSSPYAALVVTGTANPANALGAANVIPVSGMTWNGATFDLPAAAVSGVAVTTGGGVSTVAVASGTNSDTVVKASAGRLCKVLVTGSAGTTTGNTAIYDNATGHTGTIIGFIPNNTAPGTVVSFDMPAALGITVNGGANSPALTISFI